MSVESMAIALHHSRATGTAKLILIGIANHDGDGGAWPSVRTLAKYAGISDRRRIQRALATLEQLGEIRRMVQAGGDGGTPDHLRPNRYVFLLTCPRTCDRSKNHKSREEVLFVDTDDPAVERPPRGRETAPPAVVRPPKPSLNPTTQLKEKNLTNRARENTCPQGHELIDDRHCIYGCPIPELTGAPA